LAILPSGRDLAEHVFVDVALGVSILHGDAFEQVDHLGQERRRRYREASIAHVMREGRSRNGDLGIRRINVVI
jgi:hypothetical protein